VEAYPSSLTWISWRYEATPWGVIPASFSWRSWNELAWMIEDTPDLLFMEVDGSAHHNREDMDEHKRPPWHGGAG
jgi:hypothetical protein